MEEERTNNETLDEQEDDCYIFDDGTKVPWNRMKAIWEAKHDILVDDVYFEYESPDYYRYDIVNAAHPDCISMLIGASNESFDTNVAIATMYMARGVWGNWEFSTPSDKEMADLWDDAEQRLKNGQPIPMKYDPSGGPLDLCCNIIEIYPTRSDRTSQEIAEGEFTDELLEEAQQNVFAVNPEEFDSSALCAVENISHIFDSSSPNNVSAYTIKCFAKMKDSEVLNERAANYIADHIDECDLSVDEIRNAMAVWMCKPDDVYPEETGDPCRFSNEEDASFTKFLENCDHERVSEAVRLSENVQFWRSGQKDMNHYWEENFEAGPFECGNSADFAYFHYAKNDSPAPAMRDISGSAESSYVNGVTSIVTENGLEEGVAIMEGSYENLLKAKEFSWGLKEAEDMDTKRAEQLVNENMYQEVETEFSGPRL